MSMISTRGAEGFNRRAFTVDEVLRMQAAGIIGEDENFELVEGEIVPMHSKTHAHELIKSDLMIRIARALPDKLWLGVESTMYLAANTFLEPDIVLYPRRLELEQVRGADIVLAIEVGLTSLAYDRGLKAQLYARHGVQELWVIDAKKRSVWIHTSPSARGWGEIDKRGPKDELAHPAIPGFRVKLGEI